MVLESPIRSTDKLDIAIPFDEIILNTNLEPFACDYSIWPSTTFQPISCSVDDTISNNYFHVFSQPCLGSPDGCPADA